MNTNSPNTTGTDSPRVGLLGLGPMGSALGGALLAARLDVMAWNRSPGALQVLAERGAHAAANPRDVVAGSDLVLVCLRDDEIVRQVLEQAGDLTGRTIVNLTSASPDEARHLAEWAGDRGARYLTGAIMVPTALIGTPMALILYAGERGVFDRIGVVRDALAGRSDFISPDHGSAPALDLGMLEMFFAGMTAFQHAALVVQSAGIGVEDFLPYAAWITSIVPPTLEGLAVGIRTGQHPGDQDRIGMEKVYLDHLVELGDEAGLDNSLVEAMRQLAERAIAEGDGGLGWSRVVETIRQGPQRQA